MFPKILDLLKRRPVDGELAAGAAEALARAGSLRESGQLTEAVAEYRSILALHPGQWDSLDALGSIALKTGDFESAIHLYSEMIQLKRDHAPAYYRRANALNALGRWDGALADYDRAVKIDPRYAHAFCNRGAVLERLHRWQEALVSYDRALALEPQDALANFNRASVLKELKRFDDAVASYGRAIALRPDYADAYINRGNVLRELGLFEAAVESYDAALELVAAGPRSSLAHHGRGLALTEMRMFEEALASYDKALQQEPNDYLVYANRGLALKKLQRWDEALAAFQQTIALKGDHVEAYFYRGQIFQQLGRYEEALSSFDTTIRLTPEALSPYLAHASHGFALAALKRFDEALVSLKRAVALNGRYVEGHCACGHVLQELGRYEESVLCYDAAIALDPAGLELYPAYCSRAFVLKDLKRLSEALESYDRAIELKSDVADVYLNRAGILQELGFHEDAVISFDRAIFLKPDFIEAFQGRGFSLLNLGRHEMAIASFDHALALNPDRKYLAGFRRYAQMQVCDWDGIASYLEKLERDLLARRPVTAPFPVLSLVDSPLLHRLAAEIWVAEECPANDKLGVFPEPAASAKIRVGYFSADFRNHPVSLLTAELFETHDRSKFEITGFAFGPKVQDAMRMRLERAFDRFIDVSEMSDWDVAQAARRLKIDIAVDLGGFTEFARAKVFAMRAAPLQMSYIGYLGTMGAPYMDYLLADPTIIPPEQRPHYSEKIVYLPSYQVNDSTRAPVDRALARAELGLPATGFIYSSFNSNYKITPGTFDMWMRILARVDGSLLFLYSGNDTARRNLHREAAARGVDPARVVFGKYIPQEDYLARFRAMDLFLDTLPYNAGTTASDALWAGLPVLTLAGRGFAGRVAASLLTAVELPELIASTAGEYVETAVHLAATPQRLREIKLRLARNRLTTPLFDTRSFTRHLEAAYVQVHERRRAGLPPEHIYVAPPNALTKFGST
jgi:predicted O-linked N-acetylglucosamine transferase (SPINDLY family)